MSYICLILSGAALLINGLGILGRLPSRDGASFTLLIGGIQLVLSVAIAVAAAGDPGALLAVSGVFLFGITYVYVGLDALLGLGSVGLGWFCGLVAAIGVVYAGTYATGDPLLAVLWLSWAALWTLFFLVLALGRTGFTRFTGWALVLTGQATTTAPALLGLSGAWPTDAASAAVALLVILALFLSAGVLAKRPAPASVAGAPTAATA